MADTNTPLTYHKYKLLYYGTTLCIKGIYDITSYDENIIVLKCAGDILCITGADLNILSMDVDSIYISGKISDISFS